MVGAPRGADGARAVDSVEYLVSIWHALQRIAQRLADSRRTRLRRRPLPHGPRRSSSLGCRGRRNQRGAGGGHEGGGGHGGVRVGWRGGGGEGDGMRGGGRGSSEGGGERGRWRGRWYGSGGEGGGGRGGWFIGDDGRDRRRGAPLVQRVRRRDARVGTLLQQKFDAGHVACADLGALAHQIQKEVQPVRGRRGVVLDQ